LKQLIVIGNGFDIACGLKSSYSDFFLRRFNDLLGTQCKSFKEMAEPLERKRNHIIQSIGWTKNSINFSPDENIDCDYFKANSSKWSEKADLNRWDIFFLFAESWVGKDASSYEWKDVESIIYEVISIALGYEHKSKISYKDEVDIIGGAQRGDKAFAKLVHNISYVGHNERSEISAELFSELKKFELIFSRYIANQFSSDDCTSEYIKSAISLYEGISRYSKNKKITEDDQVDVLSFNYSLDEKFINIIDKTMDDVRLKSWSNIHGIANHDVTPYYPSPIFGVDNYDIVSQANHDIVSQANQDDYRILFTKPYRVIDEKINEIRYSNGYADKDLISIYGHSLGRADYSYFETIFDENNLYSSDCKIEYYYYPGKAETEKVRKRQEAITKLYNLLTDYGRTLSAAHGVNIINRLNLENRISVIPSDIFQKKNIRRSNV
jgi:hypothetical protein